MARKTFNVLFFIKKARLLKNGEAPVCMRITVNGCMVDVLVKRSCPVNLWNQAKENSKGKDRMSVELNHYLEITRLEKPRDFDPFGHAGLSPLVTI